MIEKKPGAYGGVKRLKQESGISNSKTQSWLKSQETYNLHKPIRYKFKRRSTIVSGPNDQWQCDLIDASAYAKENEGVKFLLTCIDVFSKYAWVRVLKNKEGKTVTKAFSSILEDNSYKPRALQSDKGTEFINAIFQTFLKKKSISFFTSENEDIKASIVERFNRTLQGKIHRHFTHKNTRKYVDVLQDLVETYNKTKHSSTGVTPSSAIVLSNNTEDIWWSLYQPTKSDWAEAGSVRLAGKKRVKNKKVKRKGGLKIGETVRINKTRRRFQKGYIPVWSKELFKIRKKRRTLPVTYEIIDLSGDTIKGGFYSSELQLVEAPTFYDIESIVQTRKKKTGKREFLVKWLGYPASFNSWVKEEDITNFS